MPAISPCISEPYGVLFYCREPQVQYGCRDDRPPPPMLISDSPLPTGSFVEGIAGLARFITTYLQAITCVPRTPPTASVKSNAMSSGPDQPIGFGILLTRKTSASPRCPGYSPGSWF